MAKYQLVAGICHPDKSGWTRERNPKIAEVYDNLINALNAFNANKARDIMLEHLQFDSDSIEQHNEWTCPYMVDEDGDGIYLFKRLLIAKGTIGGNPFYGIESKDGSIKIAYYNTDGEVALYFPCEEDKDPIRPLLESATLGSITEQEACEEIARIMKEWDYPIQL